MEMWKTIAVLCIVVCVGCNAVPSNSPDQEDKVQGVGGAQDTGIASFLPDLTDIEANCLQKNGQAAIDNIKAELNNTWQCFEPEVGTIFQLYGDDFPDKFTNVSDKERMQISLEEICDLISKLNTCIRPVVVAGLICFTPREGENLMSIWNAAFDGADYACYQKGSRYIEFLENDAEECINSRDEGLTKCYDKLMSLVKEPWQDVLEFNSKTCKVLFDASSCAVNELQQCPNRRPAELLEGLFNVILENLPCKKNLVKGTGSLP